MNLDCFYDKFKDAGKQNFWKKYAKLCLQYENKTKQKKFNVPHMHF